MIQLSFAIALIASQAAPVQTPVKPSETATATIPVSAPFRVQYGQPASGREVAVSIDGKQAHTTFAGKLIFGDQNNTWTSVCADVRSPISNGQVFSVRTQGSSKFSERMAKAGNIVAKFFKSARTPDQCAGLQLAVWEALEDGGDKPDFYQGRFQARAPSAAMKYADEYYEGIWIGGEAIFYETGQEGGQGQLSPQT